MKYSLGIFSFFAAYKFVTSVDPFITGGSYAEYSQYPHSAFILNFCKERFSCGGSVLNQHLVLTAGHCLLDCVGVDNPKLFIKYGHKKIQKQDQTRGKFFIIHEKYDDMTLKNDIGLMFSRDMIPLNVVKRVILMRKPPDAKYAYVAGWGIDEDMEPQWSLKHTEALIQPREVCQYMGHLPKGVFCAGPLQGVGAAERGDSGSALVINDYIQIGIVSFKGSDFSIVAYTNISYYMDWILDQAEELMCLEAKSREKTDLPRKNKLNLDTT